MKKYGIFAAVFLFFFTCFGFSQTSYKRPPQDVIDIVTAKPLPSTMISPGGDIMLLVESESMPSIAVQAQPILRLAGTRIMPRYNFRQTTTFSTGLTLKNIDDGRERRIDLPAGAKIGFPRFSHDGRWLAFPLLTENGYELWIADVKAGKARTLDAPLLNATLTSGYSWLPDNQHILLFTVPQGRGTPPQKPEIPTGPNIQETSGRVAKVRTYQDLLKDSLDAALFKYYATSQLEIVDITTGNRKQVGKPDVYRSVNPSPDGKLWMVMRIKEPYAFHVPYYAFPYSLEIWDATGALVHLFADYPLNDEVPIGGVPTGPRSVDWRALNPATLIWVEALDEGHPEKQVEFRDRLMTQTYPFQDEPKEFMKIRQRYSGVSWLQTPGQAFLTEYDWKRRWRTTYLVDFDNPDKEAKKLFDLSSQDRYNDPGRPVFISTPTGERLVVQDQDWVYLSGSGASPQGDFPFLDRVNLMTLKKERLYRCGENSYETFIDFVGKSRRQIITRYESKSEPPNYFLVDIKSGKRKALTAFKDPAPQLTGLKKQLIKYKRADGVDLSGTLYLPPDYREGERRPLVIWAYPREYSDARVAGQVRGSAHRFTFFRGTSQLFFVTQGYVLLDGAQMPVVGDPKTMNDTFVDQIVGSLKAAIDTLDEMGIIDPRRVGVGGHSYGAFMTANLLAHCDYLAAGIARSGAYNRTLTPFGFQSERRTLWEAPEIYFKVSPFMHAHKINEPILLIHGEADNNSGTFPIQSQRLFHALKGHGATARLVMLPHESHGYRAEESVLHVLAEMFDWFDKYVKNRR